MSNKKNRKINKKTTRNMLGLCHFKFLEKLKFKCNEYQRNLIIVSEEYTSKTCGNCGKINDKLGGSKTFNCNKCNVSIDRDINGARNILIKYLTGLDTTL
jgi:putative transposase